MDRSELVTAPATVAWATSTAGTAGSSCAAFVLDPLGDLPLDGPGHFIDARSEEIGARQPCAAAYPGDRDDLQRARAGLHPVRAESLRHVDERHIERGEDLQGRRPAGRMGEVMVAGHQEHGDAPRGEGRDAPGELALVRLRWVPALVGVPSEQHQVHLLPRRVVHDPVEGRQEVDQPRREPQVGLAAYAGGERGRERLDVGLPSWTTERLDAHVEVREVEDPHGGLLPSSW